MANQQRDKAVTIIPDYVATAAQSSNFYSNTYDVTQFSKYALQVNITSASSLNVAISIQESLDNSNWSTIPGSSVSFTADGTFIWSNVISSATWTRLLFTFTAGSAKFQAYAFAKL